MTEDRFEIEVSPDGGKVSLQGGAATRLGHAFADALSPFTNSLGALGDVVRTYRQENAIRALIRAQNIAQRNSINLRPVHPKFLVNWIEEASLEQVEQSGGDLIDLWAGLLVSASSELRPSYYYFKRILGDMSALHREFLEYMVSDNASEGVTNSYFSEKARAFNDFFSEDELSWASSDLTREGLARKIGHFNCAGAVCSNFKVSKSRGPIPNSDETIWEGSTDELKRFRKDHAISMLENMGLVQTFSKSLLVKCDAMFGQEELAKKSVLFKNGNRIFVEFDIIAFTPLGIDFYVACLGREA